MTCRHTLSLLEDYVDQELPADSIEAIDEHISSCAQCRARYGEAESLRELLSDFSVTAPEQEYQRQTTELILARTIGATSRPPRERRPAAASSGANVGFMRSVVSFAIALSVLLSAVLIGLDNPLAPEGSLAGSISADTPAAFHRRLIDGKDSPFTEAEWNRLTGAMLMIGSPGPIGKSIIVTDMSLRSR